MDTKEYIESGVIESYVLGFASAEEAVELEMLCEQYADIKNAVAEFEAAIEKRALIDFACVTHLYALFIIQRMSKVNAQW